MNRQQQTATNRQQPTDHNQQTATNRQQPTDSNQQTTTNRPQPTDSMELKRARVHNTGPLFITK